MKKTRQGQMTLNLVVSPYMTVIHALQHCFIIKYHLFFIDIPRTLYRFPCDQIRSLASAAHDVFTRLYDALVFPITHTYCTGTYRNTNMWNGVLLYHLLQYWDHDCDIYSFGDFITVKLPAMYRGKVRRKRSFL